MPIKQSLLQAHIQNQLTKKLSVKYAVTDQQNRILISQFPNLKAELLQEQLQNFTKEQPIFDEANNHYQVICNMITWKDSFFIFINLRNFLHTHR